MNLKTSIKTGGRDVLRGAMRMRPDIYLGLAAVMALAWATAAYAFTQHDSLTDAESVEMMTALGNGVLVVAALPFIVGVLVAVIRAVGRRTRWSDKLRWQNERFVTVEQHEAALARVREEVADDIRATVAAETDGGDDE